MTSSTPTEFHLFPKLPIEVRVEIWRLSRPGPRVVNIQESPRATKGAQRMKSFGMIVKPWISPTPVPTLLHVNQEARHEGLRYYSLSFGLQSLCVVDPKLKVQPVLAKAETASGGYIYDPHVYVDFERDIIYLTNIWRKRRFQRTEMMYEAEFKEDWLKVRYIAVHLKTLNEMLSWSADIFRGFKEIWLIKDLWNAERGLKYLWPLLRLEEFDVLSDRDRYWTTTHANDPFTELGSFILTHLHSKLAKRKQNERWDFDIPVVRTMKVCED